MCLRACRSREFRVIAARRPACRSRGASGLAGIGKLDARSIVATGVYRISFVSELELVKLPEDITLAGFTPLMLNPQDPSYVEKTEDMVSARVQRYRRCVLSIARLKKTERTALHYPWFKKEEIKIPLSIGSLQRSREFFVDSTSDTEYVPCMSRDI